MTVPNKEMELEVKQKAKSEVELTCEMNWEDFKPYCDRVFEVLSKDTTLKGFRPGKAPRGMLEREIGKEKIHSLAAEAVIKEKYLEVIREKGIEPIGAPQAEVLKLAEGNPFCFRATVQVLPKVKLPDYKAIASETEKGKVVVEPEEVKEALKFLQRSRAKFEDLKREAKKGDFVRIEYQSPQVDSGRQVKDAFLLGEGKLIKGFEEKLEGMKPGEEKEFQEEFPAGYFRKDLAGKKAGFKVKMEKVQKMELPELTDEFAQGLGKFKNLDELKKNVRGGIEKEKQGAEIGKWRDRVLERIASKVDLELPEVLVKSEQENMLKDLEERVSEGLKISFDEYLKQIQKTEQEIEKTFFEQAEVRVKNFLIIREIGRKENIKVTSIEVEQQVNSLLTSFPQDAEKNVDKEALRGYYKGILYNEKVLQKLESF